MSGSDVLRWLVELRDELGCGVDSWRIAHRLGRYDGRAVVRPLKKLERAGLARRSRLTWPIWEPTPRGREVDALLAAGTVARGGKFKPRSQLGLSLDEERALR